MTENLMSRQDLMELCRDTTILCRDIVGQAGKISYLEQNIFRSRQSWLGQEFSFAT